jgi:hypothetical protein
VVVGGLGGGPTTRGGGEGGCWRRVGAKRARGQKNRAPTDGGNLLKGAAGRQQEGEGSDGEDATQRRAIVGPSPVRWVAP